MGWVGGEDEAVVKNGEHTGVEMGLEIWHAWESVVLGYWVLWMDIVGHVRRRRFGSYARLHTV